MKNLKSLGKVLGKAEQKEVFGGLTIDIIYHEPSPCPPNQIYNEECDRCETPGEHYFDDGQCGQLFL